MDKKTIKVYLTPEVETRLKNQAKEISIEGRAWLTRFLEKLSKEELVFLDNNLKKTLKALDLK